MKYQIKEEVRASGKSTFLPMFADDNQDQYFSIEMDGPSYNSYDEALEIIELYKQSMLHWTIVETIIHTIE